MTVNANHFLDAIKATGTAPMGRGCIMLDTLRGVVTADDFEGAEFHVSDNPDRFYIKGLVGDTNAHVTLLYGLLESGNTWRESVDAVLKGWSPKPLIIDQVTCFESAFEDEEYICIIAKLRRTDNLLEAHGRLSFLPHIDTHLTYEPHITLAYVKGTAYENRRLINLLNYKLENSVVPVSTKLNYGR